MSGCMQRYDTRSCENTTMRATAGGRHLSGDDEEEADDERDVPLVERLDNVDDEDGVGAAVAERGAGVGEDAYQHVLLHVEGPRVHRPLSAQRRALRLRQHPRHEVPDRQRRHLDGDLADDDGLGAVGEELVEEGEQRAGDDADGPHAERPHRQRRVVGRRHGQPDLLHQRHVAVVLLLAHSRNPAAGVPLDLHRRRRRRLLARASKALLQGGGFFSTSDLLRVCVGRRSINISPWRSVSRVVRWRRRENLGSNWVSWANGRLARFFCFKKAKRVLFFCLHRISYPTATGWPARMALHGWTAGSADTRSRKIAFNQLFCVLNLGKFDHKINVPNCFPIITRGGNCTGT